jgi:TIR domain/Pentapeptide repeats (8 copies)
MGTINGSEVGTDQQDILERLLASARENNGCAAWNQWRQEHSNILINLSRTDLRKVDFHKVDLHEANLSGANLSGAHLHNANLYRSDLTDASLGWTMVSDINLRSVKGLATIQHQGPSFISIDVLYRSPGELPDVFLRGCGLPDEMIGFVHSIAGAIQYYSSFISYNHQDEEFATRIYNDLQAANVRCWKYTEDMKIGDVIQDRVDQAIRLHDKLLVIFSEHSVQSDWVAGEVEAALRREEKEGKQILFPVTIDDAVQQTPLGWAAAIRRKRNIGDFRAWKEHDAYQQSFQRLLRDLKAE